MDPKERLASEQALMHPYFDEIRDLNDPIFKNTNSSIRAVQSGRSEIPKNSNTFKDDSRSPSMKEVNNQTHCEAVTLVSEPDD